MSTFKFTPKKGVLANLRKSVRASTATAAVTASNGLRAAPTINKAITDGLDSFNMAVTDVLDYFDRAEEMAMENVADFFSEQLGEKVTVQDIREGNLSEKIEEASKASRLLAVRRGQLRKARVEMELQKVQKELNELEKKIADLRKEKKLNKGAIV